jgi:cytidine deaminase
VADSLVDAARAVRLRAYAPYSRYLVGAALEGEDGSVHVGCNVENASYGLTMCAERAAVGSAVAAGVTRFRRVAIVSGSEPPATPCGACRQVLAEFAPGAEVVAVGPQSTHRWLVGDLLPSAFSREQLG